MARMNDALIRRFGDVEQFVLRQGLTENTLDGVFSEPFEGIALGGVAVIRDAPSFGVRESDILSFDPKEGDQIVRTATGRVYTIVRLTPDDDDWLELRLGEYAGG